MDGALAWISGQSVTRVWTATQGRNTASQGFFQKCRVSTDRSRDLVSPLVLIIDRRRIMNYRIPFNRPTLIPEALGCVSEVHSERQAVRQRTVHARLRGTPA